MNDPKRALIVGAGAVGQVFGRHLQLAGLEVSFLVKEKYAADCRRGFTLLTLNGRPRYAVRRLEGFGVISAPGEVSPDSDLIVITVSSAALRDGDWLSQLAARSGQATVVAMLPTLDDKLFTFAAPSDAEKIDMVTEAQMKEAAAKESATPENAASQKSATPVASKKGA